MSYESFLVDVPPNSWWMDTGASIHITNTMQGYLTSRKLNKGERSITVGNGIEVDAEVIGTLHLILDSGFTLDLVNTVYVPVFPRNLVSISQLDSCGYEFKFGNNRVSLFHNSHMIVSGTLYGNLNSLNLDTTYAQSLLSFNVNDLVNKKRKRVNENSSM